VLGIAALSIAGCHVNVEEPPVQKPTVAQSTPPKQVPQNPSPARTSQAEKKGFNPKRLNQLYDLRTTTVTINGQKLTSYVMDNDTLRTIMPLDIAYIAKDQKVVSATTMKPLDESTVPSHGKAMYVLELKKGTIQRLGIRKGAKVEIPSDIKAIE
jgi:uncharacterized membrane protein (UPF0127 family)